ncbi:site-specific integrase [Flavobacterium piscinae]|nr:site-specific integrase [Flavobacterium piscinae]
MQSNQQAFKDYLHMQKNYSLHTVKAYLKDLEEFEEFNKVYFEQDSIDQVIYSQIRSWIVSLVDNGISTSSINRKISSLKSYYRFLLRIKQIEQSPLLKHKALKTPKKFRFLSLKKK